MTHILITANFPQTLLDKIEAVSPGITVEQKPGPWPEDAPTNAEIMYDTHGSLPRLELAPNLRWVQGHWAGIDHLTDSPVWHSDILITTASGIHTTNMAQYTLTQLLAWAHRAPTWFKHQQAGKWPKDRWQKYAPQELRGATVGILGYGSIGREIARLVKPFGCQILVTKRDARHLTDDGYTLPGTGDPDGILPDRIYPPEATRSMLTECDYVIITLPLTPQTTHLFDEQLLKEMKPSAYLINIGRGKIIDEKALIKALRRGWIAGAGLDVFETEPLPAKSPLWGMDNVILTPHISGFTPHYDERATDLFAQNLGRYLDQQPLLNLVNRQTGY